MEKKTTYVNKCDGMSVNGKYVARSESINGSSHRKSIIWNIRHNAKLAGCTVLGKKFLDSTVLLTYEEKKSKVLLHNWMGGKTFLDNGYG